MQAGSGTRGGIFIYREMFTSPAFLFLNKSGTRMLIALLDARKYESYNLHFAPQINEYNNY